MKNILLAFVCLLTFGFKGMAGNNDPKCCTDKCSKHCIEMCKKNNCTDKDCCKLGNDKCCSAGTPCSKDKAECCKKGSASVASTDAKNASEKTAAKATSCCTKK